MDLIYTDKNGIDVDMLPTYKLDMAYGRDENNFEVTIAIEDHCCEPECRIYMGDSDDGKNQWTEIGGIIDAIKLNTESGDITYSGRTCTELWKEKFCARMRDRTISHCQGKRIQYWIRSLNE